MSSSDGQPHEALRLACDAGDVEEVCRLCGASSPSGQELIAILKHAVYYPTASNAVIRVLLEHKADPNIVKITSLKRSGDLLRLLIEFGYDDVACEGHMVLQDYSNDPEILDWLLDQGVDINKTDAGRLANGFHGYRRENFDWSNHLLNNVAAAGDIELFDHLVSRGADPHRSLALHEVSRCHDGKKAAAMVDHLLKKHGMDIRADNESLRDFFHDSGDSGTPLVAAVDAGNLAVVEALLRKGASANACGPSLRDAWGRAIGNCMWEGFMPALRPLLEAGADASSALAHAVCEHKYEAVQMALEFGADPEMGLAEFRQQDAERLEANSNTSGAFVDFNGSEEDEERAEGRKAVLKLLTSRFQNFKPVGSRSPFE